MVENEPSLEEQAQALRDEVAEMSDQLQVGDIDVMSQGILENLFHLWKIWADFQLSIIEPYIKPIRPPVIIKPDENSVTGQADNVFDIFDEGFRLTTSRGEEGFALGQSMRKYFNTIEKMIRLLVDRLKAGGVDMETEVHIAFAGFELGQRKAFESVLNLEENVIVVNYEAGEWGDRFMKAVLEMAERGYGVPSTTPRSGY